MMKKVLGVLMLLMLFKGNAFAQTAESAACNTREATLHCTGTACELVVEIVGKPGCRLRIDDAWLAVQKESRITEDTSLRVRVVGANLLRYGLKFETKEKVVEAYGNLEKLWREVLRFVPDESMTRAAGDPFIVAVARWRAALVKHESELASFTRAYKEATLTCTDRETIGNKGDTVPGRLQELESLRQAAASLIEGSTDLAVFGVYDSTLALHEASVARIKAFETRARASAEGFVRPISFGDAGRIVTVTVTMTDLASGTDAGITETLEFFVHSTLPVTFHAGYTYSALDAFEFEPVTALAGQDLFAQINKGENTSGFVGFLSYRLGRAESRHLGTDWSATIGTDFKDPGKRLFLGLTGRVKKVLLSGGVATASVREADDSDKVSDIVNAAGSILGTRELFTRIRTTRQWRPFVAVSFAPF